MYTRYKVTKKRRGIWRLPLMLLAIAGMVYLAYDYRQYLMFWRYTDNKLMQSVRDAEAIADPGARRDSLLRIARMVDRTVRDNPTKAGSFFMSGRVHYLIGKSYLPGTFSELVINHKVRDLSPSAQEEFVRAIKFIRKGMALHNGTGYDAEYAWLLAMIYYYTGYTSAAEMSAIMEAADEYKGANIELKRLNALVQIENGRQEAGLQYLEANGHVAGTLEGELFLATAQQLARRYTNAIMNYKDVMGKTAEPRLLKLVHVNLGIIYHTQNLFQESLEQFTKARTIDPGDAATKVWLGKCYYALGDRGKAKELWNEVLSGDKENREVKQLLGPL